MAQIVKAVLFMTLIAPVLGCSSGRDVWLREHSGKAVTENETFKHSYIIKTNYVLNETKSANIGSTMIRVQDFRIDQTFKEIIRTKSTPVLTPKHDFVVKGIYKLKKLTAGTEHTVSFDRNKTLTPIGSLNLRSESYYVIEIPPYAYLVNEAGSFAKNLFLSRDDRHFHLNEISIETDPVDVAFEVMHQGNKDTAERSEEKSEARPLTRNDEINYELIYGGKDATGLHVVYREYTSDGLARQAFFQNLNYESNAKTIRFKNLNLEIGRADNEKIIFKVIEDDIAALKKIGRDALPKDTTTTKVKEL